MGQEIHYHDLLWPYGPHGLKPHPQKILAMNCLAHVGSLVIYLLIYLIFYGHIWPHRPQALKPQPCKIITWGSYVAN
jgi:hypothetical protein